MNVRFELTAHISPVIFWGSGLLFDVFRVALGIGRIPCGGKWQGDEG